MSSQITVRRKRRWPWIVGGAFGMILVLLMLAPTIAGWFAPGLVEGGINSAITGKATVSGVSLSWFGGQRIGPVAVVDDAGRPVATVDITVSRGLLGLARAGAGGGDFGAVHISGNATLVRGKDGTLNLAHLVRPAATPPSSGGASGSAGGGGTFPERLKAEVVLDTFAVDYKDERAGLPGAGASGVHRVLIPVLTGRAAIDNGSAALDLVGAFEYQATAKSRPEQGGSLNIKAKVDGLVDAAGRVTPDQARIDADIQATNIAVAVADALAGMDTKLVAAVGEQLQASIKARGTLADAQATVIATSRAVNIDLALTSAGGVVTQSRPGRVVIKGDGLAPLIPALANPGGGALTVDRLPDFAATIDRLHLPLPINGKPLDLRTASFALTLDTSESTASVRMSGEDGKAGAAQRLRIAPLKAALATEDLAKGLTVRASTSATIGEQDAGTLDANFTATGLLTADGAAAKQLPALSGSIAINNIATAIAQPLVERMGLDLGRGVGPKLGVTLTAVTRAGAGSGGLPTTDLDVQVKSANLNSTVALTLDGRTIRKREGGGAGDAVLTLRSPALLAGRAASDAGVAISEGGYAKVTLKGFTIVLDESWAPRLDQSAADAEINIGGFSVNPVAAGSAPAPASPAADPVALNQLIAGIKLEPGATPNVALRGSGKHQGADFFMQGDLQLAGLLGKDAAGKPALTPARVRPLGAVELRNMPTSLAGFALPRVAPAAEGQKPGMDLARLVRDAVGPSATIKLDATNPSASGPDARAIVFSLDAPRFKGSAAATVDDKSLTLSKLDFRGEVTSELAAGLIDTFGGGGTGGLESKPNLLSPATITISATPMTIPLAKGAADWSKTGDASVKIGLEGRALVNNVIVKGQDGKPRDLGTIGVENVLLTASLPLTAMAAGSAPKPAQARLTVTILGAADKRVLDLNSQARVNIAGGRPQGDLGADAKLDILDAAWIDTFLGKPGLLAEGLGADATVSISAVVQFPQAAPPAGSEAAAFDRATLTASIKSARLTTVQPLKATALPDHASIDSPMIVKWTMAPGWGNTYVLAPSKPGEPAPARFTAPMELTASLYRLSLATTADGQIMKPGVFLADVGVESPGTTMAVGEGKAEQPAPIRNLKLRLTGGKEPGTLGFSLTVDDAGGGPAGGGKPAVSLAGGLYGVSDAKGVPTPAAARITANGTATNVPTGIVDALAHQGGLLAEALGPKSDLQIKVQGLSRTEGNVEIVADSPRAQSRISGSMRGGAMALHSPTELVKLSEMTPRLGELLFKGLPAIGSFEKRSEDGPATITGYDLTVPVDGDLRKLNGRVVLNLGTARFGTSNAFGALLKVIKQSGTGQIGQRLEPIEVEFKNGVATYAKVMIPLGEFRVATSGTVDLVNKQLDVVTYVPFGALTDEAAGSLNSGLGKFLNGLVPKIEEATMVPIRTRGGFDKPKSEPDLEMFGKNLIDTLRPDNLLKDLLKKK